MNHVGLEFRFETRLDSEDDTARFLSGELPRVLSEPPVSSWTTVRYSATRFGVFVTFPVDAGQEAHVGERIGAVLREQGAARFTSTPDVESFDVLASSEVRTNAPA
jgi:hypothetical protein